MKPFAHMNVRSIEQAVATLAEYHGTARLNAGGTDLFGLLKDEFLPIYPAALVNIKTIAGLDYIREEAGMVKIGALTRLADLASSPLLRDRYRALAKAAHAVATPQIRNTATIGGNLCQDVRCTYYRYPRHLGGPIQCARKGDGPCLAAKGDHRYHAIIDGKKCIAVCPSDTAVALALFDADIIAVGPAGERRIAVRDFYTSLGNRLNADEMVRAVEFPAVTAATRQTFAKFTLRKPIDFAIVSAATSITVANGICTDVRIALGAVAPGVYRAAAAEAFLQGKAIDATVAAQAGELAVAGAKPLRKNGYKIEIAKTLVKRAVAAAQAEK